MKQITFDIMHGDYFVRQVSLPATDVCVPKLVGGQVINAVDLNLAADIIRSRYPASTRNARIIPSANRITTIL